MCWLSREKKGDNRRKGGVGHAWELGWLVSSLGYMLQVKTCDLLLRFTSFSESSVVSDQQHFGVCMIWENWVWVMLRSKSRCPSHEKWKTTLSPSVLVSFKNEIWAGYNRFIPAEEYGSEFGCEGCLTGSWKGTHASVKHCSFLADRRCISLHVLFYFNYMTSTHEWEPELYLHWPWKSPGGLWWNEAYVFWSFLENEGTQKTLALALIPSGHSVAHHQSFCIIAVEFGSAPFNSCDIRGIWQLYAATQIRISYMTASPLNICMSVNHTSSNAGSCW